MRRSLVFLLTVPMFAHAADTARAPKEQTLGKKEQTTLDKSLAGDITRKKEDDRRRPRSQYDQFRLGVELQVADKRREQIDSLKKIIELVPDDPKETPTCCSASASSTGRSRKYYFFEANRKDDDLIRAMNARTRPLRRRPRRRRPR